jgi:hypothetical protein
MSAGAIKNIAIRCKSVEMFQADEDDAPNMKNKMDARRCGFFMPSSRNATESSKGARLGLWQLGGEGGNMKMEAPREVYENSRTRDRYAIKLTTID